MVRLKIQAGCAFQNFLPAAAEVVWEAHSPISWRPSSAFFKMPVLYGQGSRLTGTLMWIDILFAKPENCGQRENE